MEVHNFFKPLLKIWPLILVSLIIGYSIISRKIIDKNFFRSKLNTVIVKRENNFTGGRSYDYVTRSGITIRVFRPDCLDIEIGDSVVKAEKSWSFSTYKMNSFGGTYHFYKVYRTYRE